MSGKKLDIVVHGATGYTGKLVSAYLAEAKSAAGLSWGISGRSRAKLEELATSCANKAKADRKTGAPTVFIADSNDRAALDIVAGQAKVVIACAGPFSKFGMPMVEACVAAGTHYVDITGEFTFVREMIERFHDEAAAKGVMLMPCSGFDCVASDMINAYCHDQAREKGLTVRRMEVAFKAAGGGVSRGTLESVLNIKNALKRRDMHPLSLIVNEADRKGVETPKTRFPYFHKGLNAWAGPFFMAEINERIVRRANATSLDAGRKDCSYVEMVKTTFLGSVAAWVSGFVMAAMFIPGVAPILRKYVFPAEGTGPTKDGKFRAWALGYASAATPKPCINAQLECRVEPYKFTAISAAETAMALVAGQQNPGVKGGVLTTGAGLSKVMVQRLMSSGVMTFSASTDK